MSVDASKFPPLSVTGIGLVDGLLGVNCRHSIGPGDGRFNPYEGLYDSEENRKREQLEQKQRAMERRIRATKREVQSLKAALDAATSPDLRAELQEQYQKKAAKLTEQNKAYDAYCKENDLKPLRERLQIAGWDRRQAAQAAAAGRKEQKYQDVLKRMEDDAKMKAESSLPKRLPLPDTTLKIPVGGLGSVGITGVVPSGVSVSNVYAMAGKGTSVVIRDWKRMYAQYGGDPALWQKVSGDVETDSFRYVIHWYERDGMQVEGKIKGVKKK